MFRVFVLTISLPFITGLTKVEEPRNEDLDIKEKNLERVKSKKNIKKRNEESLQRVRLRFSW